MKLLTIFSTLCISFPCNIFIEKENITNYYYVGLFLIFTNFFYNIIIKLLEYYIISLLGQNIFALPTNMFFICFYPSTHMVTFVGSLSAIAIIRDLLV